MPSAATIKTFPFFIVLIPLFFVLHGFLEYFGFISAKDALLLCMFYSAGSLVLFAALYFCYRRKWQKAAVLTGSLLILYFFFGAYHEFLSQHLPFAGRYTVLLLIILLLLFFILRLIRRGKVFNRFIMLLNLLFTIYLITDIVKLAINSIHPPANKYSVVTGDTGSVNEAVAGTKPDVYFLIFDEYASSLSLQGRYGYKNDLDSFLLQNGFHVQTKSFSNYNYTPVSIASILNMSFVKGLADSSMLTAKDMNYCKALIKDNQVMHFFTARQYEIINCSGIDLKDNPAAISEQLLPAKTYLITENTMWNKLNHDVFWNFFWGRLKIDWLASVGKYNVNKNNQYLLNLVQQQSGKKNGRPVFVFGHFYMPHEPFFLR